MPDWVSEQWKAFTTQFPNERKEEDCTIVGLNNRKNQISAVECATEVADIVCQPS